MNFDEYIQQGEPDERNKGAAWQVAIGLQAVDGLKPSDYLIETARKDIEGEITINEVEKLIKNYYQSKKIHKPEDEGTQEADKVAVNIRRILTENTFAFTLVGLTSIHRRIFNGVYKFAGKIRDYNITKSEWVLRNDTVLYVSAPDIKRAIEYDLEQERQFDYSKEDKISLIRHIAKFVSGLWQIHPFGEGNTRTIAVFTIQYLRSMGFNVDNAPFANHAWYFRNALVRANYQNLQKGIMRNSTFLEQFFRNLLLGETNELKNRHMLVDPPEELQQNVEYRTSTVQATVQVKGQVKEQVPEPIRTLIIALSNEQLSVKVLMGKVGLKHRPTFMGNYIEPAIKEGYVKMLYPDKPKHPRQKYFLTAKGLVFLMDHKE